MESFRRRQSGRFSKTPALSWRRAQYRKIPQNQSRPALPIHKPSLGYNIQTTYAPSCYPPIYSAKVRLRYQASALFYSSGLAQPGLNTIVLSQLLQRFHCTDRNGDSLFPAFLLLKRLQLAGED